MVLPFDPKFIIKTINIHTVESASCVNIGNNFPTGFESFKKHSQGFGSISGDHNQIEGLRSLLKDGGLVDMTPGEEREDSTWIKELMASKLNEILNQEEMYIEDDDSGELSEEEIDQFFNSDEEEGEFSEVFDDMET